MPMSIALLCNNRMNDLLRGTIMRKHLMLTVAVFFLMAGALHARELPYIYKGVRPLGMGGAFVALSDDANALFYNPAGLADIKEPRFSALSLEIATNSKAYDMFTDAADVDFDDVPETAAFLRKHIGDIGHSAVSVFPSYARPNFAFGVVGTARANLQVRDYQYPKLAVEAFQDAAACAGYAYPLLDGDLQVGAGVKYLFRKSIDKEYSVADITSGDFEDRVEDDFTDGSGVLLDLGVIYKIGSYQVAGRPGTIQMGLSASNLIGGSLGDAEDLDPHIDLGVATRIGEDLTLALDFVDLFGQMGEDDNIGKRIHFGLEYRMTETISARTGLNQGYLTLGVGLATKNIQLDLLTYAEEVGTYAGQRDNRRYLLRMGFGF